MKIKMEHEKIVELLEIYMDLAEKQDEVIYTLSCLMKKLHTENAQLRAVLNCENIERDEDMELAMREVEAYNHIKDI